MAAPNIVNVAYIYGRTAVAPVTTSPDALLTNSVSSGRVYKINAIYVSNVDGSTAADVSLGIYRDDVPYYIARLVSVPAKSVLDVLSKPIYLEEGDILRTIASANNVLQVVCSYEAIS